MTRYLFVLLLMVLFAGPTQAQVQVTMLGPTHYRGLGDSPWADFIGGDRETFFFLEDFEDGELNTPGAMVNNGHHIGPSVTTNSVDEDDGVIDGTGKGGHAWEMTAGGLGMTFFFDPEILGGFPTAVGIVWTDGADSIDNRPGAGKNATQTFFRATGPNGEVLDERSARLAVRSPAGTTVDDHFFGVINSEGIHTIKVWTGFGSLQVDHLQYGFFDDVALNVIAQSVPEPSTMGWLVVTGLSYLIAGRKRRSC